jgi:hypothetical protein
MHRFFRSCLALALFAPLFVGDVAAQEEPPPDSPPDTGEPPPPPPPPPPPECTTDQVTFDCGVIVDDTTISFVASTVWVDHNSTTFDWSERHIAGPTTYSGSNASVGWRVHPAKVVPVGGVIVNPDTTDVLRIPESLPKSQGYKLTIPAGNRRVRMTFERTCRAACAFSAFVLNENGAVVFELPPGFNTRTAVSVMWDGSEFFLESWSGPTSLPVP